jgi:DNA-binding SARP family transcriptional activator
MVAKPAPGVQLSLLQAFLVSIDQKPVLLPSSAQRLIAFLALQERAVGRAYVAGKLWSDATPQKANASLRSAIWRIQRTSPQLITAGARELALAPDVVVDVRVAEARARRLLDPSEECLDILTPWNLADLSCDLLPGWYDDDWIIVGREQFHQLRIHALESMCIRLTVVGRYGAAVEAGLAAVTAEPLRESAHDALIKAHLAAGNRYEAIRQYEQCRRMLRDELGLEPTLRLDVSAGSGRRGEPVQESSAPRPPGGSPLGVRAAVRQYGEILRVSRSACGVPHRGHLRTIEPDR